MIRERIQSYTENRDNVLEGRVNCIPFTETLPRFSNLVPGITKGVMHRITAASGIGKSQFTKFLYVLSTYYAWKRNPSFDYKIIYFALEESKEEFIDSLLLHVLHKKHGICIDILTLNGLRKKAITSEELEKIKDCEEEVAEMLSKIDIITDISNPYGMFGYCKNIADELGNSEYEKQTVRDEKSNVKQIDVFKSYTPHDENHYVIVITDHQSLLTPERGESLHQTMTNWNVEYCRKWFTKRFKWAVVNIQQQAADSEREQYTFTGRSIQQKVEPSLAGLGDNKLTQRDDFLVLGLFAPDRYKISEHNGYNIKQLRDNYRSLKVLKNRLGPSGGTLGLFFNGACLHFEELPLKT